MRWRMFSLCLQGSRLLEGWQRRYYSTAEALKQRKEKEGAKIT